MKICGSSNSPVASARFFTRVGFTELMLGAEIQHFYAMEADDLAEALKGLMAAEYVASIPHGEQIELAEMPVTACEVNVA